MPEDNDECQIVDIEENSPTALAATLFECSVDDLMRSLTFRTFTRGSTICHIPMNAEQV